MANSQHIPGLIRGHLGTVIMVEHGRFEGYAPYITVRPEAAGPDGRAIVGEEYAGRWGTAPIRIPIEREDTLAKHINNFLECMRSRGKPTLDVETGAKAQVVISMAVQSYREGRVLYFDEARWRVLARPPRA
jgi:hypothetical protein